MVGWHHRRDRHEFEQAPGVGDGQGSLTCCSPWGLKMLDMTERMNNKKGLLKYVDPFSPCNSFIWSPALMVLGP